MKIADMSEKLKLKIQKIKKIRDEFFQRLQELTKKQQQIFLKSINKADERKKQELLAKIKK